MSRPTFYPETLTEDAVQQKLAAETQRSFDKIVAGLSDTMPEQAKQPRKRFITVLVTMPHVKKYGKKPTMSLTYGCSFEVAVGDKVLCPPTRLNSKWTTGIVTELDGTGYRGPVKFVAAFGSGRGAR